MTALSAKVDTKVTYLKVKCLSLVGNCTCTLPDYFLLFSCRYDHILSPSYVVLNKF